MYIDPTFLAHLPAPGLRFGILILFLSVLMKRISIESTVSWHRTCIKVVTFEFPRKFWCAGSDDVELE